MLGLHQLCSPAKQNKVRGGEENQRKFSNLGWNSPLQLLKTGQKPTGLTVLCMMQEVLLCDIKLSVWFSLL